MIKKIEPLISQVVDALPFSSCHRACAAYIKTYVLFGNEVVFTNGQLNDFRDSFFYVGHAYGAKDYCNDVVSAISTRFVHHTRFTITSNEMLVKTIASYDLAFAFVRVSKGSSTHFVCAVKDGSNTHWYDPWNGYYVCNESLDELLNFNLQKELLVPDLSVLDDVNDRLVKIASCLQDYKVDRIDLLLPTQLYNELRQPVNSAFKAKV